MHKLYIVFSIETCFQNHKICKKKLYRYSEIPQQNFSTNSRNLSWSEFKNKSKTAERSPHKFDVSQRKRSLTHCMKSI